MSDWLEPPPKRQTVKAERSTVGTITQSIGVSGVIVLGIVAILVFVFGAVLIAAINRPVNLIIPTADRSGIVTPPGGLTPAPAVVTATPAAPALLSQITPVVPTAAPVGSLVHETFSVSRLTRSAACVTAGQTVRVQATGMVTVGMFLGSVTADGIENFVGTYDLVPGFRHGGLMCRISGDAQWSFCGDSYEFTAARTGCLEFEINDNDQSNNSGSFSVTVRAA